MDATPSPSSTAGVAEGRAWRPVARRAAWAAFLAPAVLLVWSAYAIWATYAPVPYVDQWVDLQAWREAGRKGWLDYLWTQHFEHRLFFPRLAFGADWAWFGGRNVVNLVVIGLTQLAGAALFIRIAQVRRASAIGLLGLAAALTLICSLMQWESFFWGFCVQVVGVYVFAAWALYAFCAGTRDPRTLRWGWMAGALGFLAIATFTSANGVFAGLAMLLVAIVTRRRLAATALAGVSTAALLAVYLHGYQTPANHQLLSLTQAPGAIVTYGATYLANVWWLGLTPLSVIVGLVGAGATAGMLVVMARDRSGDPARAALLGLALFVGMSAAVTSLGRVELGLWTALSSRYMTATAYFWGAQSLFWGLTVQRLPARGPRVLLGATLVLAILRLVALQSVGYGQLLALHDEVVLASSVLLGDVDDGYALVPISAFVDRTIFYQGVAFLRSRHMSLFADPPAATVGAVFARPLASPGDCRGGFDTLEPALEFGPPPQFAPRRELRERARVWHARGWGFDVKARRRLARVVVVDGAGRVLGLGLSGLRGPGMGAAPRPGGGHATGWIASLNRGAGDEAIAYGLTAAGTACELGRKAWLP